MDKEAWQSCSPWGHKESDMTEQLNWAELMGLDAMIFDYFFKYAMNIIDYIHHVVHHIPLTCLFYN